MRILRTASKFPWFFLLCNFLKDTGEIAYFSSTIFSTQVILASFLQPPQVLFLNLKGKDFSAKISTIDFPEETTNFIGFLDRK